MVMWIRELRRHMELEVYQYEETTDQEWDNFVYNRKSLRGKHWELWQHLSGCRQWIKVERDTATHEIFKTLKASEEIS